MKQAAAPRPPRNAPPASPAAAEPQRLSITLDLATGQVDDMEIVAADGARRELSRQERSALAGDKGGPSLEAIVEQAFAAGIEYVLGDGDAADEEPQSEAEHALLRPMIQHSAARRLMRREVLRRAVLGHLVRTAGPARAEGAKPTAGAGTSMRGEKPRRRS